MCSWSDLPGFPNGPPTVLHCNLCEVARLCSRINGAGWYAVLDQHLEHECRRTVPCTDDERGRAGVAMWAARHHERIEREVEEFHRAHPAHRGDMHPPAGWSFGTATIAAQITHRP